MVNGQKVWSSGAQFSQWGELIVRTDPDVVKHKGLTAFMVPMDAPGVEVRPIHQMSGGQSFCEVFFTDVRIADDLRIGDVGAGWLVAMTTLGFERDHSETGGDGSSSGGNWTKLLATAQYTGAIDEPVRRDQLVQQYIRGRVESLNNRRAADLAKSGTPGPEGSLGKILWTEGMRTMTETVSSVLGPKLIADTGEWGTYEWGEHVLGAPGYRIAGGSDEVQYNIIGERVLGLPASRAPTPVRGRTSPADRPPGRQRTLTGSATVPVDGRIANHRVETGQTVGALVDLEQVTDRVAGVVERERLAARCRRSEAAPESVGDQRCGRLVEVVDERRHVVNARHADDRVGTGVVLTARVRPSSTPTGRRRTSGRTPPAAVDADIGQCDVLDDEEGTDPAAGPPAGRGVHVIGGVGDLDRRAEHRSSGPCAA